MELSTLTCCISGVLCSKRLYQRKKNCRPDRFVTQSLLSFLLENTQFFVRNSEKQSKRMKKFKANCGA